MYHTFQTQYLINSSFFPYIPSILLLYYSYFTPILPLFYSYFTGANLWIIMEYLEAGSVADLIKESGPLDESSVAYVLSELLLALEYLHSERKIHRDVKVT
jgi:serine/threonine protein kinase